MIIPAFLESTYRLHQNQLAFVSVALSKIEGHINSNRMVFFPEYTDHSVKHIELILQTAVDLATVRSREIMTSADATVLTVAAGLHDLGMHLTRDGFESLIADGSRWKGVPFFDQKEWKAIWDDFYLEATRFDGRKLRQLFGQDYRPVRPLPQSHSPWDDFDYLLVGEFIRRHHARLGHEIAIFGLPGKAGNSIEVCPTASEEHKFLADVSGLVARSHGMDLRTCLEYLETRYQNRINPRGTHAVFLGALLRIADYFQIQAARAPTDRTDVDSFQSQLSEREWKVHQSIKDIHNTSGDPEAIVIVAEPGDVETFLKVKSWLHGLQTEIDRSWAILGEVYGLQRHNNLHRLGLLIRRIKSNLDNTADFAKLVSYVPEKISFEVANADLLKLLVGPLYGDDPGVGLRELFQNAIDAVREFDDLATRHPELLSLERFDQSSDVSLVVRCDEDGIPSEIIVTDRGTGMTPEIIRDYFLKAGASFRRSSTWRQEHEDNDGHSRVLRTGRFGVGALAAFLLGDKIEVTTRHAFAPPSHGTKFTARLDDEAISLDRVPCPVGTRIRILVPPHLKEIAKQIVPSEWDHEISFGDRFGHYFLQKPSLSRHFTCRPDLPLEGWLPQPQDGVSVDWRYFKNSDFEKVFWTYNNDYPAAACNGIVIDTDSHGRKIWDFVKFPNISVLDKDGRLPVNLQRTELLDDIPFVNDLLSSIAEDLCAHALSEAPALCSASWFSGHYEGFEAQSYIPYYPEWARWLIARNGFVLNEPNLLALTKPKIIIIALGGKRGPQPWAEEIRSKLPVGTFIVSALPGALSDNSSRVKGLVRRALNDNLLFPLEVDTSLITTYVPETLISKLHSLRPGRAMQAELNILESGVKRNGWITKMISNPLRPPNQILDEAIIEIKNDPDNPIVFCIVAVKDIEADPTSMPLMERWMDLCGSALIPFKAADRAPLIAKAKAEIGEIFTARRQAKLKERNKMKEEQVDD